MAKSWRRQRQFPWKLLASAAAAVVVFAEPVQNDEPSAVVSTVGTLAMGTDDELSTVAAG